MTDRWTLTFIGENPLLILASLSDIISQYQGNWLDSRSAQMGGQFVGIVSVAIPKSLSGKLQDELETFADSSEIVMLVNIDGDSKQVTAPLVKIKITTHDGPGIVPAILSIVQQQSLRLKEFNTQCDNGSTAGSKVLTIVLILEMSVTEKNSLFGAIEALGDDFKVNTETLILD